MTSLFIAAVAAEEEAAPNLLSMCFFQALGRGSSSADGHLDIPLPPFHSHLFVMDFPWFLTLDS